MSEAPWYKRLGSGLSRTREQLNGHLNVLLRRGPDLDEEFWDGLEEALILADMGGIAASEMIEGLRKAATREALPDAQAVVSHLVDVIVSEVAMETADPFTDGPACILMVGVNGTGKTTSVGKLASAAAAAGRRVVIGSADTFRAAAIEQLRVWGERAGVPVVERPHGSDPAAVVYDTITEAKAREADLILIDTAGRLHTSPDLMAELQKVKRVADRESPYPVRCVLVIDATTGQNGIVQAREFHRALDLDGVILTKLDGTAKGGIVVAVVRELQLPVLRIGVGEGIGDLEVFEARAFADALVGDAR